jgi:hypothetical protein
MTAPNPIPHLGVTRRAMSKVEQIISDAQAWAEKVFKDIGSIEMMFHAVRTDGAVLVIPAPPAPNKNAGTQIMRLLFAQEDVVAYVCITESWMLESEDPKVKSEVMRLGRIRDHLLAREVVTFYGEDDTGHYAAIRDIIRPPKGKPKLGPLQYTIRPGDPGHGEGRMFGLLPRRGAMQ